MSFILSFKAKVEDHTIDLTKQAPTLRFKEGTLLLIMDQSGLPYVRKIHTQAEYDHYVQANLKVLEEHGGDPKNVPEGAWVGLLEEDNHRIHVPLEKGTLTVFWRREDIEGEEDRELDRMHEFVKRDLEYAIRWALEHKGATALETERYISEHAAGLMNYIKKEVWLL